MKIFPVVIEDVAQTQIDDTVSYIFERAGLNIALTYGDKLQNFVLRLGRAPHRGTLQDDGSRMVGFDKRVSIRFFVTADEVRVISVLYAGRQESHP